MARDGADESQSREVERVLAAERDARGAEEAAREEARAHLEGARARARHIAARAEERVSAVHRRATAGLEQRQAEIEADASRRLAQTQGRPVDDDLLRRVADELAAELTAPAAADETGGTP